MDPRCLAAHSDEPWRCIFAEYAAPFVRAPLFFLQSQFDLWQQQHVLYDGVNNSAAMAILGRNITSRIENLVRASAIDGVGGFLDSCNRHCATDGYWHTIRTADGATPAKAFAQFWAASPPKRWWWSQNKSYSCSQCCGGGTSLRHQPGGARTAPRRLWLGACASPMARGWVWLGGNMLSHSGQCVAASLPYANGSALTMQACNASDPAQQWQQGPVYIYPGGFMSLQNQTSWGCAVLNTTSPGQKVPFVSMLWDLRTADPVGFCAQNPSACFFVFDGPSSAASGGVIKQRDGHCIVAGTTPPALPLPPVPTPSPPPMPPVPPMATCAPHSPSAGERFCNASLSFEERSMALVQKLTVAEKLDLWTVTNMRHPIPRLNIKGFNMGATRIHGGTFNRPNVSTATVGPHAINQAASFDLELVERLSNVTAAEMRAHNVESSRAGIVFLACAGGPLANSAHDPRWGRISETFGE